MTILFWNINRRDLTESIAVLSRAENPDILVLAESPTHPKRLLEALNGSGAEWKHVPPLTGLSTRTVMFFKGDSDLVRQRFDTDRTSIYEIRNRSGASVLLAKLHLRSKLYFDETDCLVAAIDAAESIRLAETFTGHTRTMAIGDFNMNPFEAGMTSVKGFNAVASRVVAAKGARTFDSTSYPFFFNPMWGLFSDGTRGPDGTYFRNPTGHASLYWHIFDQVLIRPTLIPNLPQDGVEILASPHLESLASKSGRPNLSDHFPIKVTLKF